MSDREDDPFVAEVRRIRARLDKEAHYDPAEVAARAASFAREIGMKPCGLKPVVPRFAS